MQSMIYAALGTGFTFLMTALGAAVVFFMKKKPGKGAKRLYLGFAAGVMIAATVWSLLIPAIGYAEGLKVPAWFPAVCGIVLGTVFLLGLEVLTERLRFSERIPRALKHTSRGSKLLFAAVTLHNIPEGMAVGLSFALAVQSGQTTMMLGACSLALGVGIQNLPEGAAIALPLRDDGMPRWKAFLLGAVSAVVEPVFGVAAALTATAVQPLLPYMLAFAAGAMLVVSVHELIPEACCADSHYIGTLAVIVGFVIMMLLDVALG